MEKTIENLAVYEQTIKKYGVTAQLGQAQEECAELIQAINKFNFRNRGIESMAKVAEEIADVQIMIEQMRIIAGDAMVQEYYDRKIKRLFEMVNS